MDRILSSFSKWWENWTGFGRWDDDIFLDCDPVAFPTHPDFNYKYEYDDEGYLVYRSSLFI